VRGKNVDLGCFLARSCDTLTKCLISNRIRSLHRMPM
jgi:hypothetical protein